MRVVLPDTIGSIAAAGLTKYSIPVLFVPENVLLSVFPMAQAHPWSRGRNRDAVNGRITPKPGNRVMQRHFF